MQLLYETKQQNTRCTSEVTIPIFFSHSGNTEARATHDNLFLQVSADNSVEEANSSDVEYTSKFGIYTIAYFWKADRYYQLLS